MKARVKATGKTIDVEKFAEGVYVSTYDNDVYLEENLDFWGNAFSNLDYWTRLEHQYAGMAMQALLSSDTMLEVLSRRNNGTMEEEVAREAFDYAHALVEKLKEKETK